MRATAAAVGPGAVGGAWGNMALGGGYTYIHNVTYISYRENVYIYICVYVNVYIYMGN